MPSRPRVLAVIDQRGTSLAIIADELRARLASDYAIDVVPYADLRPGPVDLLLCFWWGVLDRVRARVQARRILVGIHDHLSWNSSDTARCRLALTLRGIDRVATPDDAVGRALSDQLPVPISICPDGVDVDRFTMAPLPPTFTAGWCGATDRIGQDGKGIALLRDACERAGVPLRVQNGAEQKLPHDKMPGWHAGNSVYLCGSVSETTPLPVLEALATGRPVIGTPVGQIPHVVIPGRTGLVVERSVPAFVEALVQAKRWNLEAMAPECRAVAETRSITASVDAWRDAIERTLGATAPVKWPAPPDEAPALNLRSCRIIGADNGLGLSRDREIVARLFRAEGFDTALCSPGDLPTFRVAVQVFLEALDPKALGLAEQTILIPNPELWDRRWNPWLSDPRVTVWAKSQHAVDFFKALGAKVELVGFTSEDRLDPGVKREPRFLHLGGKHAGFKGTEDLLAAWRPEWPELTVIIDPQRPAPVISDDLANVTLRRERLTDAQLREEQNRHAFHIVCSRWEGFGHAAWEGLSTGAVVLYTDCAPMWESVALYGFGIACVPEGASPIGGLPGHRITPAGLAKAVHLAQVCNFDGVSAEAREGWEHNDALFRQRGAAAIAKLCAALEPPPAQVEPPRMPVLAAVGPIEPLPFGEAPRGFERLVTVQSPHLRCGIAEYGRQLDAAFAAAGVLPETLRLDDWNAVFRAAGPGAVVLVHYEPALVGGDLRERLKELRQRGARAVLCCHWFDSQVLVDYGPLVDKVVVHRDYGLAHDRLAVIPLGCPVFEAPPDREALRARFGHKPGQVVVTTCGFLTPWKQLPTLARALLQRWPHGSEVVLQFLTPLPFTGDEGQQEPAMRRVLHGMDPTRVVFSIDFRPEQELLERLHASDLGFVFHAQHTGSVSAATKQFVSARCPAVVTRSSHASDIGGGVVRVDSFNAMDFASAVWATACDPHRITSLRAEAAAEYERLSMRAVAGRYLDLFTGLGG